MNKISANINGVDCEVAWSEITTKLKQFVSWQELAFNFDNFMDSYQDQIDWLVKAIVEMLPPNLDRTQVKKIISVGSGISTLELLLSQYFINAHIWLVDKSEITNPEYFLPDGKFKCPDGIYENHQVGFYNDWDITNDAIATSNLDKNRIHFLNPLDPWPNDVDLIYSGRAWCWDFSKDAYWDKAMTSLKIGGSLIVDILRVSDRRVALEISEELGSMPIKIVNRHKSKPWLLLSPRIDWDELNNLDIIEKYAEILSPNQSIFSLNHTFGRKYSWIREK